MKIAELKLPQSTVNALARNGMTTVTEVRDASGQDLMNMAGIGPTVMRNLAIGLLIENIQPTWLRGYAHMFRRDQRATHEVELNGVKTRRMDGYYRLTQPYSPEEYWMRERAIAQLEAGNIDCVIGDDGCIWRSRGGVVEMEEEAA